MARGPAGCVRAVDGRNLGGELQVGVVAALRTAGGLAGHA